MADSGTCLQGPGSSSAAHVDKNSEKRSFTLTAKPCSITQELWRMTETGCLADITVEFEDGKTQPAHSAVLAAISPFFKAMLTTDMLEKKERIIRLLTVRQVTFTQALALTLGREVEVEEGMELEQLLQAADMMQLTQIKSACGRALLQSLTPETAVHIWQLAVKFRLGQRPQVEIKVVALLSKISARPEWLALKEGEVMELVRAACRHHKEEDELARAVMFWLEGTRAHPDTRARLLELLDPMKLSGDYLVDRVLFHPHVVSCATFLSRVKEAVRSRLRSRTRWHRSKRHWGVGGDC